MSSRSVALPKTTNLITPLQKKENEKIPTTKSQVLEATNALIGDDANVAPGEKNVDAINTDRDQKEDCEANIET